MDIQSIAIPYSHQQSIELSISHDVSLSEAR